MYQAHVKVDFQENCEYNASSGEAYIDIPSKEITCTLEVSQSPIRIGDTCNIIFTAKIDNKPIKIGRVIMFFDDGITKTEINQGKDFYLNNNGEVIVIYRPNRSGTFSFKYIDDSGFYVYNGENITKSIEVKKIPTNLALTSSTDFIVSLKDEIELTATVTYQDKNNNIKPVEYGTVRFLHYNKEGSNQENIKEKVIGNPVPVINGKATIKYVPMQYYDTDGIKQIGEEDIYQTQAAWEESHAEIVKAVYNYQGLEYGVEWQYFARSENGFKKLYILNPNDIGIGIYKKEGNTYTRLPEYLYNWAYANKGDNLVIVAQLYNQNNVVYFDNNENQTKDISLFIEGNSIQVNNGYNGQSPIAQDYVENAFVYAQYPLIERKASYQVLTNDLKGFCYWLTERESDLLPGFYTITASSERQSYKKSNIIDYYDETNSSMTYYFQQNFYDLQYQINFLQQQYEVDIDTNLRNTFKAQISGLSEAEKNVLNGQSTCTFSIPDLDKEFEGKMVLQNGFLNIVPNEDIVLQEAGTYNIYVSIKSGVYSYQGISFNLQPMYTQAILRVKGDLNLSLSIKTDNQYYPGVVTYTAKVQNLTNNTVTASVSNSVNNQVDNFLLTSSNSQKTKSIEELPVGSGSVTFAPEGYTAISESFNIQKATISQEGVEIKPPVVSNPNIEIPIKLNTNGSKFMSALDKNNFNIYVTENNFNYSQNIKPSSVTKLSDNQLLLRAPINVYKAGEWKIQVKYAGDSNYNATANSSQYDTFTTYENDPSISFSTSGDISLEITNMPFLEVVPILFSITNGDDILYYLGLTDTTGKLKCTLPDVEEIEEYNVLRYKINPTDSELRIAIGGTVNSFESYYSDRTIVYGTDNNKSLFNTLKEQLSNYESNYLFAGIKATEKTQQI